MLCTHRGECLLGAWKISSHPAGTHIWEMTLEKGEEGKELEGEMFVQCFISYRDKQNTHGLVLTVILIFINSQMEVYPGSSKLRD